MSQVMTKTRWLERVAKHAPELRGLVASYHPSARRPSRERMPITAPAAEQACAEIREMIREAQPSNPVNQWDKAISDGDIGTLVSLLESTWFGVPESTSCWNIPGFAEAVDLLDDLPSEE